MKARCLNPNCNSFKKYGNYCFKHREQHLLDNDSNIIIKYFTGKIQDYYKDDLKKFYIKNINITCNLSKKEIFEEVIKHVYVYNIILIQSCFRGKYVRCKMRNDCKCNNEEDFYTYEKLQDIPREYLYTYKDSKNIRWGFDIRSLKKLIDMNYDNPYTTEKIPNSVINDVIDKINILKNENYEDLDELINNDKKNMLKHRVVDMCSSVERAGFTLLVGWITKLNLRQMKNLYRIFEDTINYRAQLSMEVKIRIYPPTGNFFSEPMFDVLRKSRNDILSVILNEIDKFTKCNSDSDRKLGYIYFIISLSSISQECKNTHYDWINFIN